MMVGVSGFVLCDVQAGGVGQRRGAVAAGLSAMSLGLLGKPLDKSQQVRQGIA